MKINSFCILFCGVFFVANLFILSCTPQKNQSLLSDGSGCTDNCPPPQATQIDGETLINLGNPETTWNLEQGDLFEMSGSCVDLGRKNNRILVEGFHIHDDESISSYIDNSLSRNCRQNILGLTTAQQCFFVTHGNGLVDDSGHLFPQCVNGRFGFQVRLGNISKVGAAVKKYFFKVKLMTPDYIPLLSPTATKIVTRELSAPLFSVTSDLERVKCEIRTEGFKFKHAPFDVDNIPNITYLVKRESFGYSALGAPNNTSISDRWSVFTPFNDLSGVFNGDSVANFADDGRASYLVLPVILADVPPQPGVRYNYFLQARAGVDDGIISAAKVCDLPPPTISSPGSTNGPGVSYCDLSISSGASSAFIYEWSYSARRGWTSAQSSGSTAGCSSNPDTPCRFNMIALAAAPYFVAVRTRDINNVYGKWSAEMECRRQ